MEDDGEGGFNRIPLSNEIVLRGHTKVRATSSSSPPSFGFIILMWPSI
jgi:hypothetical protein